MSWHPGFWHLAHTTIGGNAVSERRNLLYQCMCGDQFPADAKGNGQLQAHVRKNPSGHCERQGIIDVETGEVLGRNLGEVAEMGIRPALVEKKPSKPAADPESDDENEDEDEPRAKDTMRPRVADNKLLRGFVAMRHVPVHSQVYMLFQHVREVAIPGKYDDTPEGLGEFIFDMVHLGAWANREELQLSTALARGFYDLMKQDSTLNDGLALISGDLHRLIDAATQSTYPMAVVSQKPVPRFAPDKPSEPEDGEIYDRVLSMENNQKQILDILNNIVQARRTS